MEKNKDSIVPISQVGQIKLTAEQERKLEDALPEWAKEIATNVNSVLRTQTEIFYLIQGILSEEFGFSEKDNERLIGKIKEIMPILTKFKAKGIVLLSPSLMKEFLRIVEINKNQLISERTGIALPRTNIKRIQ